MEFLKESSNKINLTNLEQFLDDLIDQNEKNFVESIPTNIEMVKKICKEIRNSDKDKWKETGIAKKVGICLKAYKINKLFQMRWINSFKKNLEEEKIFRLYSIGDERIKKKMIPYKNKYLNEFTNIFGEFSEKDGFWSVGLRIYAFLATSGDEEKNNIVCRGKNSFGQLGGSDLRKKTFFGYQPLHFSQNKITKVVIGYSHTLIITESGHVFGTGCLSNGRLGLEIKQCNDSNLSQNYEESNPTNLSEDSIRDYVDTFTKLNISNIVDAKAGSVTSLFLDNSGGVWSCGMGIYNGISKENIYEPKLMKFNNDKKIVQISIGQGGYHSGALNESGELYLWGHTRVGQCSFSDEYIIENMTKEQYTVNYDSDDDSKEVEDFKEEDFQKKNSDYLIRIIKPQLALFSESIIKFSVGWGHTVILTKNRSLYTCGRNNEFQLGIEKSKCKVKPTKDGNYDRLYLDKFTKVDLFERVDDFAITENCNIVKADGKLFVTGNDKPWDEYNLSDGRLWDGSIKYENIVLRDNIGKNLLIEKK